MGVSDYYCPTESTFKHQLMTPGAGDLRSVLLCTFCEAKVITVSVLLLLLWDAVCS